MNELEELKNLVQNTKQYTNLLLHNQKYRHLLDYVNNWSDKLQDSFYTIKTKIFWVINDIHDFPKCKTCGKPITDKNVFRLNQPEIYNYCCCKCIHNNQQVKEHKKQMLQEKYGVDNVFQLESVKEKTKETCLKSYGVDHYSKCDQWKEQYKATSLDHFGVDHPQKSQEIRNNSKNTCNRKYGVDNYFQSDDFKMKNYESRISKYGCYISDTSKEKRKQTNRTKYGVENYAKTEEYKIKTKKTCMDKYGVKNGGASFESISRARRMYFYDNTYFSSAPEIAYYIWLKDNKIDFEYQPKSKTMKYQDCKGKWHTYYPDFWIIKTNEIHEIKGLHCFQDFNKNNKMIWYRHPEKNYIAEAKQQCMIQNNVKIITNEDYKQYMDYCSNKFLSCTWYKKFKRDKNKNEYENK